MITLYILTAIVIIDAGYGPTYSNVYYILVVELSSIKHSVLGMGVVVYSLRRQNPSANQKHMRSVAFQKDRQLCASASPMSTKTKITCSLSCL